MNGRSPAVADRDGLAVLTAHVDRHRVAVPLRHVREVLPAAETTPLAHAPAVVRGVLNLRGEPLPVLDLRTRLGLPSRAPELDDHVLVCLVGGRRVGVWVDRAQDVETLSSTELTPVPPEAPSRHLAGVALLDDGLLLVSDVESFLSAEELARLDAALADEGAQDA